MIGSYQNALKIVKDFVDQVIKVEGGYVNDPSDSGGETNYGVTVAVAREFRSKWGAYSWDGTMKTMPLAFAQDVYSYKYFYKPKFDLIAEQSTLIAEELFDAGVNCGPSQPSKWLQQCLNVLNNLQAYYSDISEDGMIGARTANALEKFIDKRGEEGIKVLFNMLNCKQGSFYIDLATRREKDEKFVYGWILHRVSLK